MFLSARTNASNGKLLKGRHPFHSTSSNRTRFGPVLVGLFATLWLSSGTAQTTSGVTTVDVPPVADQNWEMVGTSDFNGDGKADILWRHAVTGNNVIWLAASLPSVKLPAMTDLNWKIKGVGDFDRDGKADILWRNTQTGQNMIWKVDVVALNPGTLQFSTASSSVTEGAAATVTVTRTGGSAGAVSATVGLGGSAISGTDYSVTGATTVSFAGGETADKIITINAQADGVSEPSETAVLTLSTATGGALLGNPITHTVTISDALSDPPPVGGGIPANCPDQTFPLANLREFTWFGNGLTQDVNLASAQTLAYRFTLGANGAVMDFTTNTLTGGQLGKDVAISACPGQFTELASAECIKTFSTQDTRIFAGSTLLCPLPAGTYFVNIRPSPVGSTGVRSLKMGGFAL